VFGLVEPCLTVAAALAHKSPFLTPIDAQKEADEARRLYSPEFSDHIAAVRAYQGWERARAGGFKAERAYCESHYLCLETLQGMVALRGQFRRQLVEIRFLDGASPEDSTVDLSPAHAAMLQCLLCGAVPFYPPFHATLTPFEPDLTCFSQLWPNVAAFASEPGTKRRQLRSEQGEAAFHPCSVCFKREASLEDPSWFVFGEQAKHQP